MTPNTDQLAACRVAISQRDRDIWRAAITFANKICVQRSNEHSEENEAAEADALSYCARKVRVWAELNDDDLHMLLEDAGVVSTTPPASTGAGDVLREALFIAPGSIKEICYERGVPLPMTTIKRIDDALNDTPASDARAVAMPATLSYEQYFEIGQSNKLSSAQVQNVHNDILSMQRQAPAQTEAVALPESLPDEIIEAMQDAYSAAFNHKSRGYVEACDQMRAAYSVLLKHYTTPPKPGEDAAKLAALREFVEQNTPPEHTCTFDGSGPDDDCKRCQYQAAIYLTTTQQAGDKQP